MEIWPKQFDSLQEAMDFVMGEDVSVRQTGRIAGGDCSQVFGLTLTDGSRLFMKLNTIENSAYFASEALGLSAIAKTRTIPTPQIFCSGTDRERQCAFLFLEWIAGDKRVSADWETFGHQLAEFHRAATAEYVPGGNYGFLEDKFIGAGKQINAVRNDWISFFRDCRLEPQLQRAAGYFNTEDMRKIHHLLDHIGDVLIEPKYPSLLHGDLWSGNVMTGQDGKVWMIDPAVYVGHAEADLAMTELFGGFPQEMYAAYREVSPLEPGYEDRRDLYHLYHLLNHLNLFGRSYYPSVIRILEKYGNML